MSTLTGLALESAEDLYEGAPCGYLSTLPNGTFTRANETFLSLTGYDRESLVSRRLQDLLTPGARIVYEVQLVPLLQMQGFINEIAIDLVCPKNPALPVILNATQTTDEGGGSVSNRVAVFNARERRQYERELLAARKEAEEASTALRRLNETLEDRVAYEVAERLKVTDQLRQSQKMEALGQLTGGIAHDFNNLLTVILGNAELLVEDPTDPSQTASLSAMIMESAERGADLNRRLLAFGRRQQLAPERLTLQNVVRDMFPLLRRTLSEDVDLQTLGAEDEVAAMADRTSLESAILNLVVNARDAMPAGGALTISTGARMGGPGDGLMGERLGFVTVSDTGTGMSPKVLERVFEPFFTTKEVGKGSGLGLSMVYGFAQQTGGHVRIDSVEGEGTAVTILLPVVEADEDQCSPAKNTPSARGRGERVLVVEDEPQVLQFVCTQLVGLGYRVEAVTTGRAALALLQTEQSFDLLLSDVVLPQGMSGVDVARVASTVRPELKVVLTSGYPDEVFRQLGLRPGALPLLRKPYRRQDLSTVLRETLDNRPGSRPS